MADRARCDLPYGHFGRGIYSVDDHAWSFERNLVFSSTTQLLEEPRILSQPSHSPDNDDRGAAQAGPPSKRHQKQIKAVLDSNPHLHPASGILSPLLRVSEAAHNAAHRHDALKGRLLSFGDIHSHSRNKFISVAAYVTGETGSDLCVVPIQKQRRGWDHDRSSWLEVPTLHGQQAIWSSHGGPIQQLQFASNVRSGSALLTVRLLTMTTIIRAVQVKRPSEDAHGSSISLTALYSVNIKHTGGHTHTDVAFNPWFSQQVALVDAAGKWTVLEFATRNMDRVARTWSGLARDTSLETGSSVSDGWARISWVSDLGTLAVCTRDSLTLFNIVNDDPTVMEEVDLGLSGAVPWVLDFGVLSGRRDHFCVLTTTHILVYRLGDTTTSKQAAGIRFRIRHYKNPEDLSLRITAWTEDEEEVTSLLVYSSLIGLTCSYRFELAEAHSAVTVDYMDLRMTMAPLGDEDHRSITSIELHRVNMVHKPTTRDSERPFQATRFYSAFVAREGLGTYQTLFSVGSDTKIPPLLWEAKLATSSSKLSRHEFVADDTPGDHEDSATQRTEPSARRLRNVKLQRPATERTIDLEHVSNLLQRPFEGAQPLQDVLASVKFELLRLHRDIIPTARTLHDFVEAKVDVGNVEDCSAVLEQLSAVQNDRMNGPPGLLAELDEHDHHLTLEPVKIPASLGLENLRLDTNLESVYDRTIAAWIAPLSDTIPGRVRLARAKLCSNVAAQLTLASRSIRIEEPPEIQASEQQPQTQTRPQVSGIQPGEHRGFALSQLDSSQPFPSSALPTPSQTPSVTTASTHLSAFAAPELRRLSKFTGFSKPAPPVLPRSLNNVLSHWKVGEDINNYDWMSTSRKLAQQDEDADEHMTETERRRAQRRAERHMRRQRKEAAASQAQQIASSQAPEIFSASQPTGMRIESQPSGIAASSQFTSLGTGAAAASQVEAGRFGGRPAAAAGKKRRRQGF